MVGPTLALLSSPTHRVKVKSVISFQSPAKLELCVFVKPGRVREKKKAKPDEPRFCLLASQFISKGVERSDKCGPGGFTEGARSEGKMSRGGGIERGVESEVGDRATVPSGMVRSI